jgi:hypothetical protein
MKRRVILRVESLDGRIVPGSNSIRYGQETNLTGGAVLLGSNTEKLGEETNLLGGSKPSGAIDQGPPTNPGLGSKPGGVGDGIQVLGGSKPSGAVGSNSIGDANSGIELFGSKPGVISGADD